MVLNVKFKRTKITRSKNRPIFDRFGVLITSTTILKVDSYCFYLGLFSSCSFSILWSCPDKIPKRGMIRISLSWDDQKAFWVVLSRVGLTLTGLNPINLSRNNNTFQLLFGMSFKHWLNCHTMRYQTPLCLFWWAMSRYLRFVDDSIVYEVIDIGIKKIFLVNLAKTENVYYP